jgi:hypothetical protein
MVSLKMKLITTFVSLLLMGTAVHAQVPLNWTIDEVNPNEDLTLYPDGSFFSEGLKSCHLQLNSGSIPYLLSEVYNVTPGAAYEFSFDVFDNDTAGQVKVYADFYDTYGFDVFGQPPEFSADSSEWQAVSWEGIIPAQAVVGYVMIKFYNQPNPFNFTRTANIWIDNIRFRQTGGDNLVANGGFEDWVLGINEAGNEKPSLSIYPNPAIDFVNIDLPDDAKVIVVTDLIGREMLRINVEGRGEIMIDVKHLPKGLYLTTAIVGNGSVISGKWLKKTL